MPDFLKGIFRRDVPDSAVNPRRVVGFRENGAVVLLDSRGNMKAELPDINTKSETLGDDPLAIYKPTGAKSVPASKAMTANTGWTYAAVNAIASEISNVQWRLYKVTGGEHEELEDHPLLDLLQSVNSIMTGIELKYVTAAHLELAGNAYWLLENVKSENDEPTAIHPLNPGAITIKLNRDTFPYTIRGYEYKVDGKIFTFEPYEILQIKYPDPNDPFVGIGIPQTIPTWIDSDNYLMEYNRKFFLNGAQIGMYIQTETNMEGQLDRIRKGFANRHEGTENAHKTPVLPKGVKLEHTGTTQKDMDFSKLSEVTRDRILAGFRVSKTILGTAESDTNRSTAETADYVFSKRTIKPKLLLILSFLNENLVPRYGDDLYLTFIDPVPEDKAARTTEMQALAGAGVPIMTQNEVRKNYAGVGPIDGGDVLLRPGSLEPAGTTETPEGEPVAPQLAKGQKKFIPTIRTVDGFETKPVYMRSGKKRHISGSSSLGKGLLSAFKDILEKKTKTYESKALKDLTHNEYMEYWKRFDSRSNEAEKELKKIFEGINNKQKEVVISNLSSATGQKALSDLFDMKEWISVTVDLATPILVALSADEGAAAFSMVGRPSVNIVADENVRAALDAGIAKMATSYNQTTLTQLTKVLDAKLTQSGGTNLKELTEAVEDVYSFADTRRAGLIAKTEAYRAGNQANLTAWKMTGVVKTIKWYTAEDQKVCPICEDLDGQIADIGSKFFDDSYGDGDTPPVHPDCRCYLRPEEITID